MTVTVYSKPSCVACTATYRALDNKGIDYKVEDIYENIEMIKGLGYLAAPVVIAGEDHWSGFRIDKISQLAS